VFSVEHSRARLYAPAVVATSRSSHVKRRRWQGTWLLVLALSAVPALTPLTQRLGPSVAQRAGLNKRSEQPPKRADHLVVDLAVLPRDSSTFDGGLRRPALQPTPGDRFVRPLETRGTADSLRAPPPTRAL
jgi:hypothetical protein